jgi:aspartyl protease family protein
VSAWIALFIIAIASLMLLLKGDGMDVTGLTGHEFAYLAAGLALLVFIGGGVVAAYRGRLGQAVRDAVTWVALGLALVTIYSYRENLMPVAGRLAGELLPGSPMMVVTPDGGPAEVRIRRRLGGHFVAQVRINDHKAPMLVDTGASTIVLTPQDAKKAGIELDKLVYAVPVYTANGRTVAARARLDEVSIGPLRQRRVEALVARPGALNQSLLGMSFLSRLRSYEFSGDYLTLRG